MPRDEQPRAAGLKGERPTRRGAKTRERILTAATELFARQGYHATTITEIGELADVQRGALYYHIQAKEELLFEILRQQTEVTLDGIVAIAARPAPADERLRSLIAFQADTLIQRREGLEIYYRDRDSLGGEKAAELRRIQGRVESVWAGVLDDGVKAGLFRQVDPIVLKGIIGLVNSLTTWFRPTGRLSAETAADEIATFVLDGLAVKRPF